MKRILAIVCLAAVAVGLAWCARGGMLVRGFEWESAAAVTYWTNPAAPWAWFDHDMQQTNTTAILDRSANAINFSNYSTVATGPIRVEYTNANGRINYAYDFQGGRFVSTLVPQSLCVDVVTDALPWTYCAWINPDTTNIPAGELIVVGRGGSADYPYWSINQANSNVALRRAGASGSVDVRTADGNYWATDTWMHVAWVFDGTGFTAYVNAQSKSLSYTKSGGGYTNLGTGNIRFSLADFPTASSYFQGMMDNVLFLTNYAASATTITNIMTNTFTLNDWRTYAP